MSSGRIEPTVEAEFTFAGDHPFELLAGGQLAPVTLRYALYGRPTARRDNVVLVCHALSGSARVADWWGDLFGPGNLLDLDHFCVLGINMLGSCYGSTGPRSIHPQTGQPYGADFPLVHVRDVVRSQALLLDHLEIERLFAVLGGSIGGMQALEWAVRFPDRVPRCVAIGAAPLNAMSLALNHLQRQAIVHDPAWRDGRYPDDDPPRRGLALARALAMCSYKSRELLQQRYGRRPNRSGEDPTRRLDHRYDVAGYLDYQGQSFLRRFDPASYVVITKMMDTFDLGADEAEERQTLARIRGRVWLVGITSDWLFPPDEIRGLAARMRTAGVVADYLELQSTHGHDGFLADVPQLRELLAPVLC
jgi:homoserine O-acetyltransferase